MKWKFTFKQVDSSTSLQDYAQSVFEKSAELLLKQSDWQVFFSMGKFDYSVEVFVANPHGRFKVKATSEESLYVAVDKAADKLSKQFYKQKEKLQAHKKWERSKQAKLERVNEYLEYDNRPFPGKRTA